MLLNHGRKYRNNLPSIFAHFYSLTTISEHSDETENMNTYIDILNESRYRFNFIMNSKSETTQRQPNGCERSESTMKPRYDCDINTEALMKSFMYRIVLLFIASATHTHTLRFIHCASLCECINFSLSLRLIQPFCFVCFIFMIIIIFNWSIFTRFNSAMILFEDILSCEYVYWVCINRWASKRHHFGMCLISIWFCFYCGVCFFSINFVRFLIYL